MKYSFFIVSPNELTSFRNFFCVLAKFAIIPAEKKWFQNEKKNDLEFHRKISIDRSMDAKKK